MKLNNDKISFFLNIFQINLYYKMQMFNCVEN